MIRHLKAEANLATDTNTYTYINTDCHNSSRSWSGRAVFHLWATTITCKLESLHHPLYNKHVQERHTWDFASPSKSRAPSSLQNYGRTCEAPAGAAAYVACGYCCPPGWWVSGWGVSDLKAGMCHTAYFAYNTYFTVLNVPNDRMTHPCLNNYHRFTIHCWATSILIGKLVLKLPYWTSQMTVWHIPV